MINPVLKGFLLGSAVSIFCFWLVARGLEQLNDLPARKIKIKMVLRYLPRYFLYFLVLYLVRDDRLMLVATALGLTLGKYLLIGKSILAVKTPGAKEHKEEGSDAVRC